MVACEGGFGGVDWVVKEIYAMQVRSDGCFP